MVVCAPPELSSLAERELMVSCLALSSSEAVRAAAATWLAAYDAARRTGASEAEAEQRAAAAWEVEWAARGPPDS